MESLGNASIVARRFLLAAAANAAAAATPAVHYIGVDGAAGHEGLMHPAAEAGTEAAQAEAQAALVDGDTIFTVGAADPAAAQAVEELMEATGSGIVAILGVTLSCVFGAQPCAYIRIRLRAPPNFRLSP